MNKYFTSWVSWVAWAQLALTGFSLIRFLETGFLIFYTADTKGSHWAVVLCVFIIWSYYLALNYELTRHCMDRDTFLYKKANDVWINYYAVLISDIVFCGVLFGYVLSQGGLNVYTFFSQVVIILSLVKPFNLILLKDRVKQNAQ